MTQMLRSHTVGTIVVPLMLACGVGAVARQETYMVEGRQHVAIAALNNILSFALPSTPSQGSAR